MTEHTLTSSATRTVRGVELPTPGSWVIDPGHTEVGFVGRHFMVTKVRGRFPGVRGVVNIAEDPGDSTVEVSIDMASVDSGSADRDEHLRSAELFDVEQHPAATFRGKVANWSGQRGAVVGDLTIKGVTRPIRLDVDYLATVTDPWGAERSIFSAAGTINREDWNISWNMVLDAGGLLVSREIRLELEVETIRQA